MAENDRPGKHMNRNRRKKYRTMAYWEKRLQKRREKAAAIKEQTS